MLLYTLALAAAGVSLMIQLFAIEVWQTSSMLSTGLFLGSSGLFLFAMLWQQAAARRLGLSPEQHSILLLQGPVWLVTLIGLVFAYSLLSFAVQSVTSFGFQITEHQGRYYRTVNRQLGTEVSRVDYERHQAAQARVALAMLMLFYLVVALLLHPRGLLSVGRKSLAATRV